MIQNPNLPAHPARQSGFTLPTILVVVAALLILAIGILIVTNVERHTSRYGVDRARAELAVNSGLECFKGILAHETANDDYLIIQGHLEHELGSTSKKEPIPYLYLARGSGGGNKLTYRYIPLFSQDPSVVSPQNPENILEVPIVANSIGDHPKEMASLPWFDPAKVAWNEILDDKGKVVSRYAYWVEDLQGKLNPKVVGNIKGNVGQHKRGSFPDPSSKPIDPSESSNNTIALHALDPASGDESCGDLTQKVIAGRPAMISPDSILGAAAFQPPQPRSSETGLLADPLAAALERNVSTVIRDYREQPVIPYALGISEKSVGKPKSNLNKLLNESRKSAVNQFAKHVADALPDFQKRQGGFPEDYLKTLAANAFDYADKDDTPTLLAGSYRGIDRYPMLSELALKVTYVGHQERAGRLLLDWEIKLFGEFWNMTSQPLKGNVQISYEVALNHSSIAGGARGIPFDQKELLDDVTKSTHDLIYLNGRFFTQGLNISLGPDEYQLHKLASVKCSIDVGPNHISYNTKFHLEERAADTRGVSVLWNGVETERINQILRNPIDPEHTDPADPRHFSMRFNILQKSWAIGKAVQLSSNYGDTADLVHDMGDLRMSHYFRDKPCSDGQVRDISPNCRNISRHSFYKNDIPTKSLIEGRVLPSEWPDGGQNSLISNFPIPDNTYFRDEPTDPIYKNKFQSQIIAAPTRISNIGRFYSTVELGNIYDPVMWSYAYPDIKGAAGSGVRDTNILLGGATIMTKARMPAARHAWPEVSFAAVASKNHGGGNTLRIGRPEHERFDVPGQHAAHLLDLFYAGDSEATTANISGQVNINTANKDTLRAMVVGMLSQDPELSKVTNWVHNIDDYRFGPSTTKLKLGTPTRDQAADKLAEAIIHSRPFASFKELACTKDAAGTSVFGNKIMYDEGENLQWTDAAAEEIFTRVHDAATLRSRNFRVWIIGQAVTEDAGSLKILAESRKAFCLFADPGVRNPDGTIDPLKSKLRITHQTDF
jgi:hypothetical protein